MDKLKIQAKHLQTHRFANSFAGDIFLAVTALLILAAIKPGIIKMALIFRYMAIVFLFFLIYLLRLIKVKVYVVRKKKKRISLH